MSIKKFRIYFAIILILGSDAYCWTSIVKDRSVEAPELAFLDVGQGDSELLRLPQGIRILTDAGPDKKVLDSLGSMEPNMRRLDLVILSHPQLDHFNGLRFLLKKYAIGAVVLNGRNDTGEVAEWDDLMDALNEKHIPILVVGEGDSIKIGETRIEILGPSFTERSSGELNDTAIVELIKTPEWKALLTGDIDFAGEKKIQNIAGKVDILKVAHHGSKFSTSADFLRVLGPKVAVIEVGKDNRYKHPTEEALSRLKAAGVKIFRTDKDGTITIRSENGILRVFSLGK